jgi:hypothetical protein
MGYCWRALHEPGLPELFMVAPRTGHLLSVAADPADVAPGATLAWLGLTAATRRGAPAFARGAPLDAAGGPLAAGDPRRRIGAIRRDVLWCLTLLPLSMAIGALEWKFGNPPVAGAAPQAAIAMAARAFGRRSQNDCLPVSLMRYALLRNLGVAADIHLGVLVPTEEMHAWVQIGAQPVLESEDVLMHYQSCVRFSRRDG